MLLLEHWVRRVVAPLAALLLPVAAQAGTAQGLPWEAPVTTLVNSLTGPVALGIALVAFSASGWALVWGGELPDWGRRMLLVVLVIAAILAAAGFINALFPGAGAVIA
jgi:type IV secretion system protein TrbC